MPKCESSVRCENLQVQDLVRAKGLYSFYEDGHEECCRIRKVRPLRKHLTGLNAWITGQRRDQSPGTRAAIPVVQVDPAFTGLAGTPGSLIKWNPLANVSSKEVWDFLRIMEVPTNELHAKGYVIFLLLLILGCLFWFRQCGIMSSKIYD